MMFFIILFAATTVAASNYLTPLQSGVYSENLGQVLITTHRAEVWVNFEIGSISKEIEELSHYAQKLTTVCHSLSPKDEHPCISFSKLSFTVINNTKVLLDKMLDEGFARHSERITKVKRDLSTGGWINAVGSFGKFLFGNMDHADSVEIDNKLRLIKEQQKNNVLAQYKYTNMVEKTISRLAQTNGIVNKHSQAIDAIEQQLIKLKASVHSTTFTWIELTNNFLVMSRAIEEKVSNVHQMIIDLHNNVLNTKYLSYKDLLLNFKAIEIKDPAIAWPFDLSAPNYMTLRKLLKFSVFDDSDSLIIVFALPFVEAQEYQLQKFYPVPTIEQELGKFIDVATDFVVSSTNLEKYTTLSGVEKLMNCITVQKTHYCSNLYLMSSEKVSCLGLIVLGIHENIQEHCRLKVISLKEPLLLKTENPNVYLSFTGDTVSGRLLTNHDLTEKIIFRGAQLLTVNKMATLLLPRIEVRFFPSNVISRLDISLASTIFIDPVILSHEKTSEAVKMPSKHVLLPEDFHDLSTDVQSLRKTIERGEDLKITAQESYFHRIVVIVIIVVLIIIIIGIAYYIVKYWNFCSKTQADLFELATTVTKGIHSSEEQ